MAVSKIQTGLRLDEESYSKLRALAAQESRSLNNLIEFIVRKYLADYEAEHGALPLCQD